MKCPKCDTVDWPDNCQQAECIRRFGECIVCRFTGSGAGTDDEFQSLSGINRREPPGKSEPVESTESGAKHHFVVTVNSDDDISVSPISSMELMRARGFTRRPTLTSLPKDAYPEPERAYVAAFTEVGRPSYPAFVSINREKDGLYSITVRTRGHDGNQMATIDKMSRDAIRSLAWDILEGDDKLFRDELRKLAQKGV